MRRIGVFCGSSMGGNGIYKEKAIRLGRLFANNGIGLVYGGANIGIMKAIANAVLDEGGEAIGVMPGMLVSKEILHQNLTETHIVSSMHERKAKMAEISDAFIALPGGFGTLDEMAEILSWNQLEIINKPLAIFNINGYFNHLVKYLDNCVNERFLRREHRNNIIIDEDESRLIEKLINFNPIKVDSKWVDHLKQM